MIRSALDHLNSACDGGIVGHPKIIRAPGSGAAPGRNSGRKGLLFGTPVRSSEHCIGFTSEFSLPARATTALRDFDTGPVEYLLEPVLSVGAKVLN
jgi:hypothetical protein